METAVFIVSALVVLAGRLGVVGSRNPVKKQEEGGNHKNI